MRFCDIKRIAILGSGMLGKYCYLRLKETTKFTVTLYSHSIFDITDRDDVLSMINDNDCIINCAAYTNVDKAELEPDKCKLINGFAIDYLAHEIAKQQKFLIHISSDFVYGNIKDNTLEPLKEDDILSPINVYGESKLEGDNNILSWMSNNYLILRVSWLFGPYGNNFIDKIYNQLITDDIHEIKVVDDQFGRLTSTKLVVDVIMNWISFGFKSGFYNLSCNGSISTKYDIACKIRDFLNLNTKIIPVKSTTFNSPAARQQNSILSCEKIDKQLFLTRSYWENDLEEYLKNKSTKKDKSFLCRIFKLLNK